MNAHSLVLNAANWTSVPKQETCHIVTKPGFNNSLNSGNDVIINFDNIECPINYLEHVEVKTTIQYSKRGNLEMVLTSPKNTKVQILWTRKLDKSNEGFKNCTFMSVMTWGENPKGIWTRNNRSGIENEQILTIEN